MATHIYRLRRKLEIDPYQPEMIQTDRRVGYTFTASVETSPYSYGRCLHI
jgi:DNA-binding response OmpR family regulator